MVNLMIRWAYLCFEIRDSIFEFNVITFQPWIFFILGLLKSRIINIHYFKRLVELWHSICELPILSGKLLDMPLLAFYSFNYSRDFFDYGSTRSWTSWLFATNNANRRGFTLDKVRCQPKLISITIIASLSIFTFWWHFYLFGRRGLR